MHEGIGKNGIRLYHAFPYGACTLLTRNDVLAIKTYSVQSQAGPREDAKNDMSFPFHQRYLMGFRNMLYNPA